MRAACIQRAQRTPRHKETTAASASALEQNQFGKSFFPPGIEEEKRKKSKLKTRPRQRAISNKTRKFQRCYKRCTNSARCVFSACLIILRNLWIVNRISAKTRRWLLLCDSLSQQKRTMGPYKPCASFSGICKIRPAGGARRKSVRLVMNAARVAFLIFTLRYEFQPASKYSNVIILFSRFVNSNRASTFHTADIQVCCNVLYSPRSVVIDNKPTGKVFELSSLMVVGALSICAAYNDRNNAHRVQCATRGPENAAHQSFGEGWRHVHMGAPCAHKTQKMDG